LLTSTDLPMVGDDWLAILRPVQHAA
jgi:hypothetical protein